VPATPGAPTADLERLGSTTSQKDGEIVTAEELAWAMHAELCDWEFHTILAEAREGPE
jgi:hypothetical protein